MRITLKVFASMHTIEFCYVEIYDLCYPISRCCGDELSSVITLHDRQVRIYPVCSVNIDNTNLIWVCEL
jgi:hypothetical protein